MAFSTKSSGLSKPESSGNIFPPLPYIFINLGFSDVLNPIPSRNDLLNLYIPVLVIASLCQLPSLNTELSA